MHSNYPETCKTMEKKEKVNYDLTGLTQGYSSFSRMT